MLFVWQPMLHWVCQLWPKQICGLNFQIFGPNSWLLYFNSGDTQVFRQVRPLKQPQELRASWGGATAATGPKLLSTIETEFGLFIAALQSLDCSSLLSRVWTVQSWLSPRWFQSPSSFSLFWLRARRGPRQSTRSSLAPYLTKCCGPLGNRHPCKVNPFAPSLFT